MTQIVKSQSVMHIEEVDPEFIGFTNGDPGDVETQTKAFALTRDDWEAFGCPGVITVTVELGDLLNDEDAL